MPKKKKFELEAVAMAAGVGIAAQPLMDVLQKQVFKKQPQMVPAVLMAAGIGLSYMGGSKFQPAALALIAITAGDLSSSVFNESATGKSFNLSGFSRVNYLNGGDFNLSGESDELDMIIEEDEDGTYSEE